MPVTSLRKTCVRPSEVAEIKSKSKSKIKSKIKIKINSQTDSSDRYLQVGG
ncbi:hypothetical protein F477_01031 [Pseudomonas sp. URIL14HWK12:I3]|uniref:hypothetical protein n=1 Tax=Pseudomonas sp. URIL14HWK12:I3 TaxID=1261631 RepID=UPI000DB15160|nr:hypothetical protein [Pseudomonas sp. URIL14HWK12:I3]PZW60615.1 hypothetical protein F477_01031 [Pseudomonas sp. URIL14HWK12:I3]